ncbi:MAG: hypothetical protein J2P55_02085 [Rhizobiales bacterium]|nr:hypothetical protein [Hyphomicrobiales bacterium]
MIDYRAEVQSLRRKLMNAVPNDFHGELCFPKLETYDDVVAWRERLIGRVVDAAVFSAHDRTPACPLCGKESYAAKDWFTATHGDEGATGWTEEGLIRHLRGSHNNEPCLMLAVAHDFHCEENREKFDAARHAKYARLEQERRDGPHIRLHPTRKPEPFDDDAYFGPKVTEARIAEAGFTIERDGKVVTYRLTRGDFVAFANPVSGRVLIFKRSGEKSWKRIADFWLRKNSRAATIVELIDRAIADK